MGFGGSSFTDGCIKVFECLCGSRAFLWSLDGGWTLDSTGMAFGGISWDLWLKNGITHLGSLGTYNFFVKKKAHGVSNGFWLYSMMDGGGVLRTGRTGRGCILAKGYYHKNMKDLALWIVGKKGMKNCSNSLWNQSCDLRV